MLNLKHFHTQRCRHMALCNVSSSCTLLCLLNADVSHSHIICVCLFALSKPHSFSLALYRHMKCCHSTPHVSHWHVCALYQVQMQVKPTNYWPSRKVKWIMFMTTFSSNLFFVYLTFSFYLIFSKYVLLNLFQLTSR